MTDGRRGASWHRASRPSPLRSPRDRHRRSGGVRATARSGRAAPSPPRAQRRSPRPVPETACRRTPPTRASRARPLAPRRLPPSGTSSRRSIASSPIGHDRPGRHGGRGRLQEPHDRPIDPLSGNRLHELDLGGERCRRGQRRPSVRRRWSRTTSAEEHRHLVARRHRSAQRRETLSTDDEHLSHVRLIRPHCCRRCTGTKRRWHIDVSTASQYK